MTALYFLTPTAIPIEAATTMGISVKDGADAIGKFGTGLKYAIAGILRLNGTLRIWVGGELFDFTAVEAVIRGRSFRIVHCNGTACGYTTELGKHWAPWQYFRELASNALDEGGSWTRAATSPDAASTVIEVRCREVDEAERDEQVFLGDRDLLLDSTMGAKLYSGESRHYYFRGIRAGSFDSIAPVTVNIVHGELSEDRMLDMATTQREIAWGFRTAVTWSKEFLLSVIPACEPSDFWVQNVASYYVTGSMPADVLGFLEERPKFVRHPVFRSALDKHLSASKGTVWTSLPRTEQHRKMLAQGEALCLSLGVDPIPEDRAHFTTDLSDNQLAVTRMDTRHVWFSTQLMLRGRDEFLAGYLEEALHAMTGLGDCTREFQNALLAMLVTTSRQIKEQVPA